MTEREEYKNALNGYMNLDVHINKTLRLIGISAIKKQIPKKVVNIDEFADYAECPSCGAIATDNLGCLYGWCRKCGQKLKRSEEE